MKHFLLHGRHIPFLFGIQVAFIIIFGIFVDYDKAAHSARAFDTDANATKNEGNNLQHYYPSKRSVCFLLVLDDEMWRKP